MPNKKYVVRICVEELCFDEDGDVEDSHEAGWSLEIGPYYTTEAEAVALRDDLIERAELFELINNICKGE